MKKIITLLLILLFALTITGCNDDLNNYNLFQYAIDDKYYDAEDSSDVNGTLKADLKVGGKIIFHVKFYDEILDLTGKIKDKRQVDSIRNIYVIELDGYDKDVYITNIDKPETCLVFVIDEGLSFNFIK